MADRGEVVDMPRKAGETYRAHAAKLDGANVAAQYRRGDGLRVLERRHRVPRNVLSAYLAAKGIRLRYKGESTAKRLDERAIVRSYRRHSVFALAAQHGVSRTAIARVLRKHGQELRAGSDAQRLRARHLTKKQRRAWSAAAHAATRGRKRDLAERSRAALTKQARGDFDSPHETLLHELLLARGMRTIPQHAIGPYCCDLGAFPVAVEVWAGGWHLTGNHAARWPERTNYILDAGWDVLVVFLRPAEVCAEATADEVVAYVEQRRRTPTACRQYRVIRCDGQVLTTIEYDPDQLPTIEALCARDRSG